MKMQTKHTNTVGGQTMGEDLRCVYTELRHAHVRERRDNRGYETVSNATTTRLQNRELNDLFYT